MAYNFPDVSPEVACTLITIAGSVITVLISNRNAKIQARSTASDEVEKMTRTWQREDKLSSEEEFKAVCETIAAYLHDGTSDSQGEALVNIAGMRATTNGQLAEVLDGIYETIRDGNRQLAEKNLDCLLWVHRNPNGVVTSEPVKKHWYQFRKS